MIKRFAKFEAEICKIVRANLHNAKEQNYLLYLAGRLPPPLSRLQLTMDELGYVFDMVGILIDNLRLRYKSKDI